MKIRAQFILNIVVLGIILLLDSAAVIITNRWVENTHQQEILAAQIEGETYELGYLANDYLLYRENQQASRWESKFASFSDHLANMYVNTPEQLALLTNIKTNQQRLKAVFEEVKARIEGLPQTRKAGLDEKFMQVSWSRLEVQTQAIIFNTSRLERMLNEQEHRLDRLARLFSLVLIAMLGVFLLINYQLTFRRILQAITGLQSGTRIIGAGNLDFAIEVKSDDEIGELSHAFNQMTGQLRAITASRADLKREIAERKQAEEQLRYQAHILANIHDAVVATDLGRRITSWNLAAERMFGWSQEQVLGKPADEVVRSKITDEQRAEALKAMQEGTAYSLQLLRYHKDGHPVWIESTNVAIRDSSGNVTGYVSVGRDITERKQAEQETVWLASFPERNPNPVVEIDLLGVVFYMNPAAQHRFPELKAQGFRHPWLAGLEAVIRRFQQEDVTELHREIQIDGAWYSQPIYYVPEAGRLRVYGADITERKQSEEKMQRSEGMLRAILDQMPSGVTVRDASSGELVLSNARSREILSTLVDSPRHFDHYRGFHADGLPYQNEEWPLSRSLATGEVVQGEEVNCQRVDDTWTTLSINSAPVRDLQGRIVMGVGVFDDITGRKEAEEALRRTTEDLRRSNAELEQFAYVASHDLQEPLRMISSYVQLLSKRYQGKLDSDADEFIAFAVDGAKRMQNLINDLLMYSRVGTRGKSLTPVSGEELLEEALANLQFMIEENEAQITHDPMPIIHGDPIQLVMVFQNLLGNAIKFRGSAPLSIHIGVRRESGNWVFSVQDNGIGIDPKFSERIFVIFQRLNDRTAYPGTGIGLAICKRIIQRHAGSIWVESKPGEGATFYFTLPVKEIS